MAAAALRFAGARLEDVLDGAAALGGAFCAAATLALERVGLVGGLAPVGAFRFLPAILAVRSRAMRARRGVVVVWFHRLWIGRGKIGHVEKVVARSILFVDPEAEVRGRLATSRGSI